MISTILFIEITLPLRRWLKSSEQRESVMPILAILLLLALLFLPGKCEAADMLLFLKLEILVYLTMGSGLE